MCSTHIVSRAPPTHSKVVLTVCRTVPPTFLHCPSYHALNCSFIELHCSALIWIHALSRAQHQKQGNQSVTKVRVKSGGIQEYSVHLAMGLSKLRREVELIASRKCRDYLITLPTPLANQQWLPVRARGVSRGRGQEQNTRAVLLRESVSKKSSLALDVDHICPHPPPPDFGHQQGNFHLQTDSFTPQL